MEHFPGVVAQVQIHVELLKVTVVIMKIALVTFYVEQTTATSYKIYKLKIYQIFHILDAAMIPIHVRRKSLL